jgi:hypothetical protein
MEITFRTREERDRLRLAKSQVRKDRLSRWQPTFCWFPVIRDGKTYWLQKMERRAVKFWRNFEGTECVLWEYREVLSE